NEDDRLPTIEAKRAATDLLTTAAAQMPQDLPFPFPHVSSAGEGDLFCEWRTGPATVVALISPSGLTGIHRLVAEEGGVRTLSTVSPATPADLVAALVWLTPPQAAD